MKEKSRELCRITGLDPAGPGFNPEVYKYFKHISSKDAKFVDIIHTNAGVYGTSAKSGSADFYPNGGFSMPGCAVVESQTGLVSSSCSHNRAVDYFAESVKNPKAFTAVSTKSFSNFKRRQFLSNNVTYMGIACKSK